MSIDPLQLDMLVASITEPWTPVTITRSNDQHVFIAKFHGTYHWHSHDKDDLFYVYKGKISILLEDQPTLELSTGNMAMIPAGIAHCPTAEEPAYVVIIEPNNMKTITTER